MTPMNIADFLREDPRAVENLKIDISLPIEIIPAPLVHHLDILARADIIPANCHGRNHIPLLGRESTRVMTDVISGVLASTEAIGTDAFDEALSRHVGRTVLRSKKIGFAGKTIVQVQIHLKKPVFSQRIRIPMWLTDKAILRRRHVAAGAAPGLDFFIRHEDAITPFIATIQSLIVTVCVKSSDATEIGLGTVYAGTSFPGEAAKAEGSIYDDDMVIIMPDGNGIFFKWYPDEEARAVDASLYSKTIPLATHMDVLLDPGDYQTLTVVSDLQNDMIR